MPLIAHGGHSAFLLCLF